MVVPSLDTVVAYSRKDASAIDVRSASVHINVQRERRRIDRIGWFRPHGWPVVDGEHVLLATESILTEDATPPLQHQQSKPFLNFSIL